MDPNGIFKPGQLLLCPQRQKYPLEKFTVYPPAKGVFYEVKDTNRDKGDIV
jgi:hypothetical protein